MNICTIISKNYLAHARVLAESFWEYHPDGACTVLVLDDPDETIEAGAELFEVLRAEEISIPNLDAILALHEVAELAAMVKPWLLKHLLRRGASHIAYFDPDIQIFAPLDDIGELAEQNGIVLVPRITGPIPRDGEKPSEHELASAGIYDPGFVAVGSGETPARFLDWWVEGLSNSLRTEETEGLFLDQKWTPVPQQDQLFVDQRWIDLVPNIFPDTKLLQDPGCDIAYWNLHGLKLERTRDRVTVNGCQLRFFHFSGFQPELPHWLSKHATRVKVSENAVLADLCRSYATLLWDHGYEKMASIPYRYSQLPNGMPYDSRLRQIYAKAIDSGEDFGNIFEPQGAEAFLEWLNAPSQHGGQHGVTRFMYDAFYAERKDLQWSFKNLDGPAGKEFVRWFLKLAVQRHNVPDQLVPFKVEGPPPDNPEPRPKAKIDGVNVVGFLTQESGLGEIARKNVAILQSVGISVATKTITLRGRHEQDFAEFSSPEGYSTNLICMQPPELLRFHRELEEDFFKDRRSIGIWAWEIDTFPENWLGAFDLVDEIWVWTSYVARTLSRVSSKPVVIVPPPVAVPDAGDATVDIGIPEGFTFLFIFDFYSVPERKNPLGLVEAFKRAFAPDEGPQLVIKSMNGDNFPQYLERLRVSALDRPDIHVIDQYLSLQEKNALMAGCDCYVSLHRSEGFGLTPAEAMALGKPTIATAYSGNTDFMTNANSYLVNYSMTEVGPESPPYPADGMWAAPGLDHAAQLMRRVWENPDEARARGERAKKDIEENLSPEAIGSVVQDRLRRLAGFEAATTPGAEKPHSNVPDGSEKKSQAAKNEASGEGENGGEKKPQAARNEDPGEGEKKLQIAQKTLAQGPAVEAPSKLGRAGRFARRLVLRAIWPFTHYQKQLDNAVVGTLQELTQKVKGLRSNLGHQKKHLERLESGTNTLENNMEQRFKEIEEQLGSLDGKLAEVASGPEMKPVPARETSYLGHDFMYPYDSLIGEIIDGGQEWDPVLRTILSELVSHEEPMICEVGSNIGASLLQMLAAKPHARLLAFEPSARFRPFLERNLKLAGFDEVEIYPLLLGRKPGATWLYNNSSSASVVSADYDGHEPRGKQLTEMTTLDEVLRGHDRVDFIKVDTDGFDFEVLRGAKATIKRDQPILYFELAAHMLSAPATELAWLQNLGYRKFICLKPQGKLPEKLVLTNGITEDPGQAVAWANEDGLCDVLACPEGSPAEARLGHIEFIQDIE